MNFLILTGDPDNGLYGLIGVLLAFGIVLWAYISNAKTEEKEELRLQAMSPTDRKAAEAEKQLGPLNASMVCPHCQAKGMIRTKAIEKKAGISGGKATAAVLTGGVSVLATGLSRKEGATQAHCEDCRNTWSF